MEEAAELGNYLPLSFKTPKEQEYIEFLWDAFETNYTHGKYQFAFFAYHNLQYLKGQLGPVAIEDSMTILGTLTPQGLVVPAGAVGTSAIANGAVTAAKLATQPAARVRNSSSISINSGAWTALTFDTEQFDMDGIHDTGSNTSRLTCKTAGTYTISGCVLFTANGGGERIIGILINGLYYLAIQGGAQTLQNTYPYLSITTIHQLAVNDYVELMVYQNSGGPLNAIASGIYTPHFAMAQVG